MSAATTESWRSARLAESKRSFDVKPFFEQPTTFSKPRPVPTGKPRAQGGRSDRSQRRPLPISEAPHETGVSGFVDVSKDTDRRDSVLNFERVHARPVPAP